MRGREEGQGRHDHLVAGVTQGHASAVLAASGGLVAAIAIPAQAAPAVEQADATPAAKPASAPATTP